jgi:ADP-heptose:LPS heptosyltransferase
MGTPSSIVANLPTPLLVDLPNWLGDFVHTLPALERLRDGNAGGRTCALLPAAQSPLARLAGVEALARPERAAFWWARRELHGNYSIALTARHATRAKLLLAGSGAALRLASRGRGATVLGLSCFPVERGRHQRHDMDAALARLGLPPVSEEEVRLALPNRLCERGRELRARLLRAPTLVALLPAARGWPAKRFPAGLFAAVGELLAARGIATVVVVGPGEGALAHEVAATVAAPVAPPELPLDEVAGFLAACDAAVGNDSGLTHLAAVVGCPTVTLFGPTDPARTAPVGGGTILRAAGAPRRSLAELLPARVIEALLPFLGL